MSAEPVTDADVLAAFRKATDWTDEDVLHYATCNHCIPICGYEESDCPEHPAEKRRRTERKPVGVPVRPQPPLPAGLRRASS